MPQSHYAESLHEGARRCTNGKTSKFALIPVGGNTNNKKNVWTQFFLEK